MQLSITQEELNALPPMQFQGKIVLVQSRKSLDNAIEELSHETIIGFDTEARPSFRKGEYHPTSLIQMATEKKCFLVRSLITGLTDSLIDFFQRDTLKVGIALHDDLIDLRKIRPFQPDGFVDLNQIAMKLKMDDLGAKKLSAIFLKGKISKNQQTSNWENPELTDAQQLYAATDAWVCLKIYQEMIRLDLTD